MKDDSMLESVSKENTVDSNTSATAITGIKLKNCLIWLGTVVLGLLALLCCIFLS